MAPPPKMVAAMLSLFERRFNASLRSYTRALDMALRHRKIVLAIAFMTFGATAYLFNVIPKGFFRKKISASSMFPLKRQKTPHFLRC